MSQGSVSPRLHLGFLDGVRGVAATYVVLHHAALNIVWSGHSKTVPERTLLYLTGFGHYAVDVFIVLSGYCLMMPVLRSGKPQSVGDFLRRRAWRILPPYYASMLISILLIATVIGQPTGTHWDVSPSIAPVDVLSHILLIQEWFRRTAATINHVYWSIGVEWKIYFLFPLLCLLYRRFGAFRTTTVAVGVSFACWLLCNHFEWLNPSPWGSSPYYVGLFTMGMLAATYGEAARGMSSVALLRLRRTFLVLSLVLVSCSLPHMHDSRFLPLQVRSVLVGVWAAGLLVLLRSGGASAPMSRLFEHPITTWLGRVGYSLYLIHAPILQLVYCFILVPTGLDRGAAAPWIMLVCGTAASVLAAFSFYEFVELPFHRISRRQSPWSSLAWRHPLSSMLAPRRPSHGTHAKP